MQRHTRWTGLALLAVGGFAAVAWGDDLEGAPWMVLVALALIAGLALCGLLRPGGRARV